MARIKRYTLKGGDTPDKLTLVSGYHPFELPVWNMQSTASLTIPIANGEGNIANVQYSQISGFSGVINSDNGEIHLGESGLSVKIEISTLPYLIISRDASGKYHGSNFSALATSRGTILLLIKF